jgi:hypothetical protein
MVEGMERQQRDEEQRQRDMERDKEQKRRDDEQSRKDQWQRDEDILRSQCEQKAGYYWEPGYWDAGSFAHPHGDCKEKRG